MEPHVKPEPIPLRPHHLLCVHGFRGLGYDAAFIRNMRQVVDALFAQPAPMVLIVRQTDVICEPCIHRDGTGCRVARPPDRTVLDTDDAVLDRLGLRPGDCRSASELMRLVAERIAEDDLEDICAGCRWLSEGYCREGLAKLRLRLRARA